MVERSDLHKELLNKDVEKAMERYGFLSEEFQKAGDQTQNKDRGESIRDERDSSMHRNDHPNPHPKPPEEIAKSVDRKDHNNRWEQEIERAKNQERERDDDRER